MENAEKCPFEIDCSFTNLPRRRIAEYAFFPSGRIVVMTENDESGEDSYWFERDGKSPKGSYLVPVPQNTRSQPVEEKGECFEGVTELRRNILARWASVDMQFVGLKARDLAVTLAIDEMLNQYHKNNSAPLAPQEPAPLATKEEAVEGMVCPLCKGARVSPVKYSESTNICPKCKGHGTVPKVKETEEEKRKCPEGETGGLCDKGNLDCIDCANQ